MAAGRVTSIHLASEATEPMRGVGEAHCLPGRGIEGDRYFWGQGTFSNSSDTELTLIESEAIEALDAEYGLVLNPGESRRNVVTSGVELNALVGREFRIGEVRLHGARLAEPCAHLARLVVQEVLPGLLHRGGLRARILAGGVLRTGDAIEI